MLVSAALGLGFAASGGGCWQILDLQRYTWCGDDAGSGGCGGAGSGLDAGVDVDAGADVDAGDAADSSG